MSVFMGTQAFSTPIQLEYQTQWGRIHTLLCSNCEVVLVVNQFTPQLHEYSVKSAFNERAPEESQLIFSQF